jgi:Lon protease-like protein
MGEMAMFPLQSVLVPGAVLPLQVFEPRYVALLEHCLGGDRRFGVTLIERGSEVGGGDIRSMAGTVAEIMRADQLADGRWAVLAIGTERIRVDEWLDDAPFPRARVTPWPDAVPVDADAAAESLALRVAQFRRVLALAVEMGLPADPMAAVTDQPSLASHELSALAPLSVLDRQKLLVSPGPIERLALLGTLLDEVEEELRARLAGG